MKIETLKDRISKAEETITKKQNTIEKKVALITKKQNKMTKVDSHEADWLKFDIKNLQEDITRLQNEVAEKQKSLEGYKEQLEKEIEKANSRNVKVIINFLEMWKGLVKNFYEESLPKWIEAREAYYTADSNYCDEFNRGDWRRTGDKTKLEELKKVRKIANARFNEWKFLNPYIVGYSEVSLDWDKIQKDLDYEANMKYDFIIERTNRIVGQITDASYLSISEKGDLNGIIYGTKGKAFVETIGAGGYNIQCFHFRTLIHEVK
jgi:DNA repair exonuclease SbcCD ATPase subunit